MKKLFIFFLFFLSISTVQSQGSKSHLGITSEFGYPSLIGMGYIGGPSYHAKHYFGFGLAYVHSFSKKLELETGLTFSRSKFSVRGHSPHFQEMPESFDYENYLTTPLYLRWYVLGNFFINAGPNISWDMNENTYGPGYGLGLGYQVNINKNNSILINPMFQARGLSSDQNSGVYHVGLRLVFTTSSFF